MMYWSGMGWGGWIMMTVTLFAFWALVAAGIVALVRSTHSDPAPHDRRKDARQLLDERFARGEIDEDDYNRRRELLITHH